MVHLKIGDDTFKVLPFTVTGRTQDEGKKCAFARMVESTTTGRKC